MTYNDSYPNKLKANILEFSKEKSNVTKALKEWFFTGVVKVSEFNTESGCHFCGRIHFGAHFEIDNVNTKHKLLIGSECILNYGIKVTDTKGKALSKTKARRILGKKLHDYQLNTCMNSLLALEKSDQLTSALNYYKSQLCFTPKHAVTVFAILNENKIYYNARWFIILFKKDLHITQLRELKSKIALILPALSSTQLDSIRQYLDTEQIECIDTYMQNEPKR